MSRSYHITLKAVIKDCTKKDIDEQVEDPDSDLRQWGRKRRVKKAVKKARKNSKVK